MCSGSWLVKEIEGMPFPIVQSKSKVTAETFDLRSYLRELILGLVFGVVGLSLYSVLFLWAINFFGEPNEYDIYLDEVSIWCAENMPDAKPGECSNKTGY